jgi:hypothetical protein
MKDDQSCSIKSKIPELSQVEIVNLHPENEVSDYQQAVALAKSEAEKRFDEYMLVSWYDRDRDFESPPHTTESCGSSGKDGYIHYGLSHGAKLMVDIEDGRFVFFYTPVEWGNSI